MTYDRELLTISMAPSFLRAWFHRAIQICYANDVNCLIKQKSSHINNKLISFIIILLRVKRFEGEVKTRRWSFSRNGIKHETRCVKRICNVRRTSSTLLPLMFFLAVKLSLKSPTAGRVRKTVRQRNRSIISSQFLSYLFLLLVFVDGVSTA